MLFEIFSRGIFISAWGQQGDIQVVFASRPSAAQTDLLGILLLPKKLPRTSIVQLISLLSQSPIDPILAREKLPREFRALLSLHLLRGLEQLELEEETLTADSAWKYEQLLDWGETSAVSTLANYQGVRVGTMRARLAHARNQGLLDSPGKGSRKI